MAYISLAISLVLSDSICIIGSRRVFGYHRTYLSADISSVRKEIGLHAQRCFIILDPHLIAVQGFGSPQFAHRVGQGCFGPPCAALAGGTGSWAKIDCCMLLGSGWMLRPSLSKSLGLDGEKQKLHPRSAEYRSLGFMVAGPLCPHMYFLVEVIFADR